MDLAHLTNLDWTMSFLVKLLLSFVLGSLLGWERSARQPVAGVTTHMIIACGSCLISACGDYLVVRHPGSGDATRLAGQILAGIGMVGAGVIIRRGVGVTTTAATIFLSAGIGIACGLSFYLFATLSTLIVVLGLKLSYRFLPGEEVPGKSLRVVCKKDKLDEVRHQFPPGARLNSVVKRDDLLEIRIYIRDLAWNEVDRLMESMLANSDVVSVQFAEERTT